MKSFREWLREAKINESPENLYDMNGLQSKEDFKEKVKDNFRVVYQVQENWKTGRSFEDAFILGNANELANFSNAWFEILKSQFENLNKDQIIENWYWDVAEYIDKNSKKTDFAFDIMMMDNFIVPKYIREGLIWLSKD